MYLANLHKINNELPQQYKLSINNYKLLSSLNAAIKVGNIGISEFGNLINLVFSKLMNNDLSKLSLLSLSSKIFIKKKIVYDTKLSISNIMLQLNEEIDVILQNISDAITNNTIKNDLIQLTNNSIITIGKRIFNNYKLELNIPRYHHSTKLRPLVYDIKFYDNFIIEKKLKTFINNQISHIYRLNDKLFINKLKKNYYLMCVTITFYNKYQNIIDIISKFIGNDIITINNSEKFLNFYNRNKEEIISEIEDYEDFYIENKEKMNIYNENYKDFYNENKNIELIKIYNNFLPKLAKYIELI